jgi:guanosine-3',5'-bis(diphosphate) 3'-pyrophosphohydrolase
MLRQYELVERVRAYDPDVDEALLNRAYVFTVQKHGSQKRASGDPYFSHPVEVAGILTDLHLDAETIVTALLHDTLEDTLTTPEEIERLFGADVGRLVDGVTKLSKIEAQTENERAAENLRKFLLAMSDDIRVLLVKLADRLHNMRTLHFIKNPEKRRRIAKETMDIYAPLAERIGMYEYMREMQLLAFSELEPEAYATITGRLAKLTAGGKDKVTAISREFKELLAKNGIEADVSGREKHPYSIWRKMQERHVSFEQVTDIIAFRIITPTDADCYAALGLIHRKWKMVPGRFKDYISTPKRNGYKSLHTTIMHQQNMRIEIQLRSLGMHQQSEFGFAAHWAYKQGGAVPDGQAGWIRDLIEILEQTHDPEEFLENTRIAMYQDRIFAFTPKGSLHQLPKGATPVDFAYAVHTGLGDRTVGAKVNGRLVPLRTQLNNGDTVEILSSDKQTPQPAWLGFAVTRERLKLDDDTALYVAIAKQRITDNALLEALVPGITAEMKTKPGKLVQGAAVSIAGLTPGVAYQLADCCHPVPGDRIVGLSRPGEGIEVHVIDCPKLADGIDADWIDLRWQEDSEGGNARLCIVILNEPGTLAEMSGILAANMANITNLRLSNREGGFHTYDVVVEVRDVQHVMRILSALRASDTVVQAERQ